MTTAKIEQDAAAARAGLVAALDKEGVLGDPRWRAAVATVPRHLFVPGFFLPAAGLSPAGLTMWEPVTEHAGPGRWLEYAYSDTSLVTQLDNADPDWTAAKPAEGGVPTSSATLPSLVVRMWADADILDGHHVLEIGTGTGYSTALACERLGSPSLVTSLEVDSDRLAAAYAALGKAGYHPHLAVADGLYGYWPDAPYDRIVAACSVRRVPPAWIEQTRPGGKILASLGGWAHGYARALLTVNDDGTASGPLLPGTISFMPARTDVAPTFGNPSDWASRAGQAGRETWLDPAALEPTDATSFHLRFLAQCAVPNAQWARYDNATILIDVTTGSVARVAPSEDLDGWAVAENGPQPLWGRVEAAVGLWETTGRPGPERYGLSIEADGTHTLWMQAPDNVVAVLPTR